MTPFVFTPDRSRASFGTLNQLWSDLDQLDAALTEYSENAPGFVEDEVDQIIDSIRAFEPSFSVIGPSGTGKSTLINALAGQPGLLPAGANRGGALVPALHLNARFRPLNTRALFRFFGPQECEPKEQQAEFNSLIGGSRVFADLDPDTIHRYLGGGEPAGAADAARKTSYAEITKYADLYIDQPFLPKGLALHLPPAFPDTSPKDQQIALRAVGDSPVCVMVVSAHSPLPSLDKALLQFLCSLDAPEVLIFVNQIDELDDPAGDSRKIKAAITKELQDLGIDGGFEILFGSGYWAECAQSRLVGMNPTSRRALAMFYGGDTDDLDSLRHRAFEASGIEKLLQAVSDRLARGAGRIFLQDVTKRVESIITRSETEARVARTGLGHSVRITERQLRSNLLNVTQTALRGFDERSAELRGLLRQSLESDQESLVSLAVSALQDHIKAEGVLRDWTQDPAPLRLLMKTSFAASTAKLRREGENAFDQVLDGTLSILANDLGVTLHGSSADFPKEAQHRPPTLLAQSMSLALKGEWWRRYWRFGAARAAEKRVKALIREQATPLIDALITESFDPAVERTREIIKSFGDSQIAFCKVILDRHKSRLTAAVPADDGPSGKGSAGAGPSDEGQMDAGLSFGHGLGDLTSTRLGDEPSFLRLSA